MARTSKDPLEGLKLGFIPGQADKNGTVRAGVKVERDDVTVELFFRLDDGEVRFQHLIFDGDDIDSTALRLPLTAIKKWAVKKIMTDPDLLSLGAMLGDQAQRRAVEKAFRRSKAELGLTVRNDEHWAFIAEGYLACCRIHPSEPIVCLRARLEEQEVFWSRSTVANEVKQARKKEWLTSSTRGKAGAEAGPKLLAYREKENEE